MEQEPICTEYAEIEEDDPLSGGGGSDPGGFPSEEPGECNQDPYGPVVPCEEDGTGGGTSIPPPPDPCEEEDPPAYCECEVTGYPVLDNLALQSIGEDLWAKQDSSNEEQGGFLYQDTFDEWRFFELKADWVPVRTLTSMTFEVPSELPSGSVLVHTHPSMQSAIDEFGIDFEYNHNPSPDDSTGIVQLNDNHGVAYGVILDPVYRILYDSDGSVITKSQRCGY